MHSEVIRLCEAVKEAGGRAMLVGGWVRDFLLGFDSKDYDVEVYGLEPARLRALLETLAPVNTVGEHFAVYKLAFYQRHRGSQESTSQPAARFEIDVSLPRRESKSGRGHRGFIIEGDPSMSFEEAARRRDFTINAILYDPLARQIVDPFGGAEDLKRHVLRAVAEETFVEDSLRVLRAVQLAARFEMTIEEGTAELCRTIDLADLPRERVWGEVEKLLTLAARPSTGLEAALDLGVLAKLFPEIRALAGPAQDESQRQGESFARTKAALDEAAKLAADLSKARRVTVMLATLCHDLRKPFAASAIDAVLAVMERLGLYTLDGYDVRSQVVSLVREQGKPREFYESRDEISNGDFRRLARAVEVDLLYRVAKACAAADSRSSVAEDWFIEKARAIGVEQGPPAPLLQGRHLIEAGFQPGPRMGEILRHVYELQLDDKIASLEEAVDAARRFARPGCEGG